jgi:hypothetical protein
VSADAGERPAIDILTFRAPTAEAAHGALGAALGEAIRDVAQRRCNAVSSDVLLGQLATALRVRKHLEGLLVRAATPDLLRTHLGLYLRCVGAWADAAELTRVLPVHEVLGTPFTAFDLALFLQDDNTGCQTGCLRGPDGQVLLFHTEEDTVGYFDRPRIVHMDVAGVRRSAFLYPYLLPGPAFGWNAQGVFAYDTLNLERTEQGGTPTSTWSWLCWWMGAQISLADAARALTPFLDGGALVHVLRGPLGIVVEQVEVGGLHVHRSLLVEAPGMRHVQVNILSAGAAELGGLELYDAAGREPYVQRLARGEAALAGLCARPSVASMLQMLGGTDGGTWAFSNADVVAHFVAEVRVDGMALHVGAGAARGEARAQLVWELP